MKAIFMPHSFDIKILDRRARCVFAKKELGVTDDVVDAVETEEDSLTEINGAFEDE
jgi:hypothetical protein